MIKNINNRLILLRHAESLWNKENLYTGWYNIGLTESGRKKTKDMVTVLIKKNLIPNMIYTSAQLRAIQTADIIHNELIKKNVNHNIPIISNWHLNERHYGLLTGLNKTILKNTYTKETVHSWVNSYYGNPPIIKLNDLSTHILERIPNFNSGIYGNEIREGESLELVYNRVVPYFNKNIMSKIKDGNTIMIVSHSNTIRVLIKYLENIDIDHIRDIKVKNIDPITYKFNENFTPERIN